MLKQEITYHLDSGRAVNSKEVTMSFVYNNLKVQGQKADYYNEVLYIAFKQKSHLKHKLYTLLEYSIKRLLCKCFNKHSEKSQQKQLYKIFIDSCDSTKTPNKDFDDNLLLLAWRQALWSTYNFKKFSSNYVPFSLLDLILMDDKYIISKIETSKISK